MTAIETINEAINETTQTESSQTESTAGGIYDIVSSTKQGCLKKYTDKGQATIAAREQRKNARIRYKALFFFTQLFIFEQIKVIDNYIINFRS
ncbi:MAG: hypothetical protein EZS28_020286 [Streblomastix strix]|uniref:Uncharacterized protein n=1 Tax=Streblomastix strix TaxID=222440 RepID=A0A5J4VNF8_9EUKA|nr:MAG: hypothetical protein EZS28_020286 [Streblomastix strix]